LIVVDGAFVVDGTVVEDEAIIVVITGPEKVV